MRLRPCATLFIAHFTNIPIEMNRKCARIITRPIVEVHLNPKNLDSNSHGPTKT